MAEISFNDVPREIGLLGAKLDHLIHLWSKFQTTHLEEPDRWFDIDELCAYLPEKPSKPAIYKKVSEKAIPFEKPNKKLIFLKSRIDLWLLNGQVMGISTVNATTDSYIRKVRRAK